MRDDTGRDWASFEHDGETYLFDLTFLLSNWNCIFGAGCKGVLEEDSTDLGHGCCSHGAHFADRDDRKRVSSAIASLTAAQWQFKDLADDLGGVIVRNGDGDWVTRTHDGACILLNRGDHHGGVGCALHVAADEAGDSFVDYKPEVCWQLPLRFSYHTDEVDHTTYTLRAWKRRDWGEGGADLHWWCTEGPEAFTSDTTVLESMGDEIVALVGEPVYERLLAEVADRDRRGTPVDGPMRRAASS